MPINRFYLDAAFVEGQNATIKETEFHHLVNVTRSKQGQSIELVNGKGQLAEATIETIEKKQCIVSIEKVTQQSKPNREIILVQGIPRANRLDNILEKGTELGMTQLWLLPATTSEKKSITEPQLEKMRAQMIAAMKQCGRLFLPEIKLTPPLKEHTTLPYPSYYGDIESSAPPFRHQDTTTNMFIFIGPESGFTEEEILHLKRLGAKGVSLNSNILRTDTAAIVALAIASS